jgi:hypothetical protein
MVYNAVKFFDYIIDPEWEPDGEEIARVTRSWTDIIVL